MTVKLLEFASAIRGFHYYRNWWQPEVEEVLDCAHEADNQYDYFVIKTCQRTDGSIVGHLPTEISRATKYLLLRGSTVTATLSSTSYRRSPLVQGGLEIPCRVSVWMPETMKNREIAAKYKEIVDMLYTESDGSEVLGSFLHHDMDLPTSKQGSATASKTRTGKSSRKTSQVENEYKDIRLFFQKKGKLNSETQPSQPTRELIELD